MYNAVLGKTMKTVRNHRDIKLITTKARNNYLVYHTTKIFSENVLAIEMKRTQILMKKQVYFSKINV